MAATEEQQLAEYEYWIAEYSKAESKLGKLLEKPKNGQIVLDGKNVSVQEANQLLSDLFNTRTSYDDLAKPLRKTRQDQQRKAEQIKTPGFTSATEYKKVLQKRYQNSLGGERSYGTPAEIYSQIEDFDRNYSNLAPKPLPTFKPTKVANITQLAQKGVTETSAQIPGIFAPGAAPKSVPPVPASDETVITDETVIKDKVVVPVKAVVPAAPTGAVSEDKILAQLELRGLPDTPENRKIIREELAKQPGLTADWKERFIAEYPQYAQYLTDPMYGDDVTQVFQRAMEEKWFKYGDIGLSVFTRELGKTVYGLKTNSTQKTFDAKSIADQNDAISDKLDLIRSTYGNFGQNGDTPGLSDQELFNLARESARNGYTTDQDKRAIYSYVYNADPTADRTAVIARIEAGKVGQDVNKIYNDYLLAPDKNAIKRYATGEITLEDVKREARALTSEMYPALKRLIDQGVSVKAISDQYAATAGTILEKDDTTINMADTQYRVAFSAKDAAGNPSLMSLGEWQTMLKTNADYGWQYTKAANSQALDTATMIARTFGKVQ